VHFVYSPLGFDVSCTPCCRLARAAPTHVSAGEAAGFLTVADRKRCPSWEQEYNPQVKWRQIQFRKERLWQRVKPRRVHRRSEERPRDGKSGAEHHEAAAQPARNYPEVAEKLGHHITETEGQIRRIEEILAGLDEDHSSLKDMALSVTGSLAALGHTVAGDEILKNSFANFAFENYEIAAYKSLLAVAEAGGFMAAVAGLKANLAEEEAMASWLDSQVPLLTQKFLSLRVSGRTAKV
jgi:ferritin-like metal-binding protein YciE